MGVGMASRRIAVLMLVYACVCHANIPPVRLGELQTLRQKIESGALKQADAQRLFQQLAGSLSVEDRKHTAVQDIIHAAEQKYISLSFDGKTIVTREPLKGVPTQGVPGKPVEAPVVTHGPVTVPEGPKPAVPAKELTAVQLQKIRLALKQLEALHRTMNLDDLTKVLDKIQAAFGGTPMPDDIARCIVQLEAFETMLRDDLKFLNDLGDEVNTLYAGKYARIHTDPKLMKEFIRTLLVVETDIDETATRYKNNKSVIGVADKAQKHIAEELYKILKKGLVDVARLTDDVLFRKCVRAYAYAVERFPIGSTRKIETKELAKSATTSAKPASVKSVAEYTTGELLQRQLNRLAQDESYTAMDPNELEKTLQLIEEGLHFLSGHDRELFWEMDTYLKTTYEHLAILNEMDDKIQKAQKYANTQPTDLSAIDQHIEQLLPAEDTCNELLEEQKLIHGKWAVSLINARLEKIQWLINVLSTHADSAAERERVLQEEFEWIKNQIKDDIVGIKDGIEEHRHATLEPTAVRALKLEHVPDSPAAKTLKQQEEKRERELRGMVSDLLRELGLQN